MTVCSVERWNTESEMDPMMLAGGPGNILKDLGGDSSSGGKQKRSKGKRKVSHSS